LANYSIFIIQFHGRWTGEDRRRGSPLLKLEAEAQDATIKPPLPHKRRRRVPVEPDSSHSVSVDTPSVSIQRPKRPTAAGAMDGTASGLADLLRALLRHLHDEAEQTRIALEELEHAIISSRRRSCCGPTLLGRRRGARSCSRPSPPSTGNCTASSN
jgi:hypothetical protein